MVSLMKCSQHLRTKLPSSSDLLPGGMRLASTNLMAVETLLKLCKEIEVDYPRAFGCLSSHLGSLFKATYSLLKVVTLSVRELSVLYFAYVRFPVRLLTS